jgi:hypothetical protein
MKDTRLEFTGIHSVSVATEKIPLPIMLRMVTRVQSGQPGSSPLHGMNFLFATTSKPTQACLAYCAVANGQGMFLISHFHDVLRLRTHGTLL